MQNVTKHVVLTWERKHKITNPRKLNLDDKSGHAKRLLINPRLKNRRTQAVLTRVSKFPITWSNAAPTIKLGGPNSPHPSNFHYFRLAPWNIRNQGYVYLLSSNTKKPKSSPSPNTKGHAKDSQLVGQTFTLWNQLHGRDVEFFRQSKGQQSRHLYSQYWLALGDVYTKLKYSRSPAFDVVSGGFAALLAALLGFLISEKFGYELVDSGDFYYAYMYALFAAVAWRPLLWQGEGAREGRISVLISPKLVFMFYITLLRLVRSWLSAAVLKGFVGQRRYSNSNVNDNSSWVDEKLGRVSWSERVKEDNWKHAEDYFGCKKDTPEARAALRKLHRALDAGSSNGHIRTGRYFTKRPAGSRRV